MPTFKTVTDYEDANLLLAAGLLWCIFGDEEPAELCDPTVWTMTQTRVEAGDWYAVLVEE